MKIIFLLSLTLCFLQTFQKEYDQIMDNLESEYLAEYPESAYCNYIILLLFEFFS
jgi:hypothetical protein